MRIRASLVTFALLAAAGPVVADTVTLKNGREIHGKLVSEGKTEVRLRTAGGTITIPRADIATFNENDFIEPALDRASEPTDTAQPAGGDGAKPADGAKPTDGAKPADGGAPAAAGDMPTKETWVWAAGLDKATIDKMTPLRDKYIGELEKIGPTPAARLKKVELDAEETAELDKLMESFDRRQSHVRTQGGRRIRGNNTRNQARRAAANNVADYGALAIKPMRDKMRSANALDQRMSAQTITKIGPDDDFKAEEISWYRYHFDVPGGLIAMLGTATDPLSYLVRNEANNALMGVTGQSGFGFELGKGQEVSPAEAEAARQWSIWWSTERNRWVKEEEAKEKKRAALLAALEEVRAGKEPATDPLLPPPADAPPRRR